MKHILLAGGLAASMAMNAAAGPLETCPTQAFLIQGSPAKLFAVDLSTGAYRALSTNTGARKTLNAFAFNTHDNYLYGWDRVEQTLFRMGEDYVAEHLTLSNPLGGNYYVGDISLQENAYYIYRKGSNALHGLWRISLDSNSNDYLQAQRIANGSTMYLNIYDFAFHPDRPEIYSVDNKGELIQIDASTGEFRKLGNVGVSGTFGAVYFDRDGKLYVSRNKDGVIFQVDIDADPLTSAKFAQGPASSSNDGARCAIAPVVAVDKEDIDFGDAPDSYGTTLAANGARHAVVEGAPYFGSGVDGEAQAYLVPDSDDATNKDDEDGVAFVSTLSVGQKAIIQYKTSGTGYVNAWLDYNQNGQFDGGEQIITDKLVNEGEHTEVVDVPVTARGGISWARFRVSSVSGAQANGGMPDGEVEDHQIKVSEEDIVRQYYPSEKSYVTLAFEDLWPSVGDYDMNDFVTHYRTGVSTIDDHAVAIHISGQVVALGATFHNGFAVQVDKLPSNMVDGANILFEVNGEMIASSPLEAGHSNAVFVIAEDLWDHVIPAEGCTFYRTEANCGKSPIQFTYSLEIPLSTPVPASDLPVSLFKPFLHATNGFNRNSIFNSPPGRGLEIHLKNNSPSDLADAELLGRADDTSLPNAGLYYQTEKGLPWAIEIGTEWKTPGEYVDLIDAYPSFIDYVTSEGESNKDWYLPENAVPDNLYED